MIVNKTKLGFGIINHESHGLLAGKIAWQISSKYRPQLFFETLIAVTEHDDRQLNFNEKQYLSENGIPLDFNEASTNVNAILKRMKRVVREAKNKSGWVRLLVSYHLEFLYTNLINESKKVKTFFTDEEQARIPILALYNSTDKKAREAYQVLKFSDRLSLILCQDETPSAGRSLEINTSIDDKTFYISRSDNDELIIKPWIFESKSFQLCIEEKLLETTHFKSSKEFENELNSITPTLKTWIISNE